MKVCELIEHLLQQDPEMEIVLPICEFGLIGLTELSSSRVVPLKCDGHEPAQFRLARRVEADVQTVVLCLGAPDPHRV